MSERIVMEEMKDGDIYYFPAVEQGALIFLDGRWRSGDVSIPADNSYYQCTYKGNIFSLLDVVNERGEET